MRLLLPVLLSLPLLALQAHAQTSPSPSPAAAPAPAPAPAAATQAAPTHARAPHPRMTWQQRFAQANSTHDGHLTLQQAQEGYRTIARHFAEIDVGKKGYVTVDDINAWHKLQRAMRHHQQPDQTLRPRPAMQHGMPAPREINTATDTKVAPMTPPSSPPPGTGNAATTQPQHGT